MGGDIEIIGENDNLSICAMPGDTINLGYTDDDGVWHTVLSRTIDTPQLINRAVIAKVGGDTAKLLGLKAGLIGAFGEKIDSEKEKDGR